MDGSELKRSLLESVEENHGILVSLISVVLSIGILASSIGVDVH